MITYSVLGFLIGAGTVVALAIAYGGLTFLGLKLIFQNKANVEHARVMAEGVCIAQASLWDQVGFPESAGLLIAMAHRGVVDPMPLITVPKAEEEQLIEKYDTFVHLGNVLGRRPEVIVCGIHGESLYDDHIECLRCKRVYDDPPTHCLCGYRLLPKMSDNNRPVVFSGKTICKHCYKDRASNNPDRPVREPLPDEPLLLIPQSVRWGQCENCESTAYIHYGPEEEDRTELQYTLFQCPVCGHREGTEDEPSKQSA